MKTFSDILKGIAVGALAGVITLMTISGVSASPDSSSKLVIPALPSKPLTVNSSADEVLTSMLESDQKWDSLVAKYQLSIKDPETNEISVQNQYFWLDKKGEWARVETDGIDSTLYVRNAATIAHEKRNQKIYFQAPTPNTFKYNGFNPRELLLNAPGAVYLHPYGKALPTGYYDFLYPTAIAQSMIAGKTEGIQEIQVLGEDEIAGRQVILISRMPKNHLYWVDAITGVVLRVQYFGEADNWQVQFEAQSIKFDVKIPGSTFQFVPSPDSRPVEPSEFYLQNQGK